MGDGDKQCKCKECVEGATKWLVGQLIHHADEACDKVSRGEEVDGAVIGMDHVMEMSSPGEVDLEHHGDMKKWCKFWADQREVAIGFLVELMRPWTKLLLSRTTMRWFRWSTLSQRIGSMGI